jgi:hypothetical protein
MNYSNVRGARAGLVALRNLLSQDRAAGGTGAPAELLQLRSRRAESLDQQGQYMLIDAAHNCVLLGSRYDASLEAIAEYLSEEARR